jgi:hypothetical protein
MSDFIRYQDPLLQEILNQPLAEIQAPIPYPPGKYLCLVDGPPVVTEKQGENYQGFADFELKLIQAGPDVDLDQLQKALGGKNLTDKTIRRRFFLSKDSAWRMKRFLHDDLGIEPGTLGRAGGGPAGMGPNCPSGLEGRHYCLRQHRCHREGRLKTRRGGSHKAAPSFR